MTGRFSSAATPRRAAPSIRSLRYSRFIPIRESMRIEVIGEFTNLPLTHFLHE
jgi:hypothetical protein